MSYILLAELKSVVLISKLTNNFFKSPAEVSTNVIIKRQKTDEGIHNETDNEEGEEILLLLHEAHHNHFIGNDIFISGGEVKLSRIVAYTFNDFSKKEYKLMLNRVNKNSKRPDLSCVIEGVSILNSEFKHLVMKQKNSRRSGHFIKYGRFHENILHEFEVQWDIFFEMFKITKMMVDKASILLADYAISHLMALEEYVERITKDFKYRRCRTGSTTPPEQISYMCDEPNSSQLKKLLRIE
ncbi:hypothetical protein GLOIN_2v1700036 [Rhizophagus clarus]|uniref:Uncharacterized protein n=1 Tax=Rhizophagus clarus TaxID=94130 RepID=A0A8H3LLJ7_9GLOM|nr:hypothetical protein GLOIN_2v1700036 [Rhizophagus clarus]